MDGKTEFSNIPPSINAKIGKSLHNMTNHPIEILKNHIYDYFDSLDDYHFHKFDNLSPFVSVSENFDKLLIPNDHPARSKSDTYYVNKDTVLRTHTSAHQNELLSKGFENFLVSGDVYRKDEIDRSHYPVFHQLEGIGGVPEGVDAKEELFRVLNGLVEYLFPGCEYRINDDYFPFTNPSYEYEVKFNGEWLEILGCGIMHQDIVRNNNLSGQFWAWGLGYERLCMIKFGIPDIRYFWSTHNRFLDQFQAGEIVGFKPFSKLPNINKDISFWIPDNKVTMVTGDKPGDPDEERWIDDNEFFELVREVAGDWIEEVKLMDKFFHPKKKKHSRMYSIVYSPNDPDLKDGSKFTELCNSIQAKIREKVNEDLDVELR